jgi:hypothetical protein
MMIESAIVLKSQHTMKQNTNTNVKEEKIIKITTASGKSIAKLPANANLANATVLGAQWTEHLLFKDPLIVIDIDGSLHVEMDLVIWRNFGNNLRSD